MKKHLKKTVQKSEGVKTRKRSKKTYTKEKRENLQDFNPLKNSLLKKL